MILPFWLKGHSLHLHSVCFICFSLHWFTSAGHSGFCSMRQLHHFFSILSCASINQGVLGYFGFSSFIGFLPGRTRGVMDRARIPQQSTATLFSWLLLILSELCRRFGVDLGTVVIECFEVNYPVPPSAVPAPCQSRCAICGSPCSRHSPAHLQHRCADHRRNQ